MEKHRNSSWFNLLVVLVVTLLALSPLFPFRVTPASASPEKFSGERAFSHLPIIAQAPHPSGSPAQALVRDYIVQQLTALSLEVDVQKASGAENVVARLKGTDPSGAILILAHYDSYRGPGAADNGAGVAALLEIMRALTASLPPSNDIIALFDDSEELPDPFTGTKAFIRNHPLMADVRLAIGLDTAVRGFIATDDTGSSNGWMVGVLARSYTNGAWTSLSGGGNYDTEPFRMAGIQVLELEDNYPFSEQHTQYDVPAIVNPGSLQQLGEQALAVVREVNSLDLEHTSGPQQTYSYIPYIGLFHYPQAWALPLAIIAVIFMIIALGLALRRRIATWGGLGVVLLAIIPTAGIAALGVNAIWKAAPMLLKWETHLWTEWPEVIPPNGWAILISTYLIILALVVVVYRFIRRRISGANFSLLGLLFFLIFAVVVAVGEPKAAIIITWPVLIGALIWIIGLTLRRNEKKISVELIALLAAIPTILNILPLEPAIFMSDGTKSVAITAGVWVIILAIILPGIDGLIARPADQPG